MPNEKLLREVLDYIKTHPQSWYQDAWFAYFDSSRKRQYSLESFEVTEVNSCNTAYCFAGHVALRSGFAAPPKNGGSSWYDESRGQYVDDFAKQELGITASQADALFGAENTLEDLEYMVNEIIENPEVTGYELRDRCPSGFYDDEDYEEYYEEDEDEEDE